MYWAPWVKLMMLSRPKMTARPEAQQRVERAVDQPDEELPEQRLRGMPKTVSCAMIAWPRGGGPWPSRRAAVTRYFFTSGQSPWSSGRKAWSAGMVARSL